MSKKFNQMIKGERGWIIDAHGSEQEIEYLEFQSTANAAWKMMNLDCGVHCARIISTGKETILSQDETVYETKKEVLEKILDDMESEMTWMKNRYKEIVNELASL